MLECGDRASVAVVQDWSDWRLWMVLVCSVEDAASALSIDVQIAEMSFR